jgi:hypothetical protein
MNLKPGELGPKEREMMKRFSVLLPSRERKAASHGLRLVGSVQHHNTSPVEIDPESWSNPELNHFCNADLFQWPFEMWTSFRDFEVGGVP